MRRRDNLAGYLLIAPQLLGSVLFVLLPLGLVLWYSLHEWNVLAGTFEFVGGKNYDRLLADANLREVLGGTALFSAGLVVLNLALALVLAILLNQRLAGTTFFTQGGPGMSTTVLVYYLYRQAFQFHHFGYGATLSVLLFAIVALLTVVQWRMRRKWVFNET
ncbi:carbohydrate ABC transporter permease [Streptosporangium sp. DT93]|uniref:carbohydrate ABC transporter permease n=1 Tax=Streptosporangium sp. DT93 TaxID=3393428 RepID=UPI003CF1DA67